MHFTGIAWAGGAGEPVDSSCRRRAWRVGRAGFVSGACLAIPPRALRRRSAACPNRSSSTTRTSTSRCACGCAAAARGGAAARVDHGYEFDKGAAKWRYLERNRWATLIRTYPAALLALLMPALLATELALLVVSAAGGWLPQKLRAYAETARSLPRLLRERREIQATRGDQRRRVRAGLTASLDSALPRRRGPLAGASRSSSVPTGASSCGCLGARRA